MLEGDNNATALASSQTYPPIPNVLHFHDPERIIGAQVANSIGGRGRTAWDFYVLYDRRRQWTEDGPPGPLSWFHQLGSDKWADPSHFRWGEALGPALDAAIKAIEEVRAA